MTFYFDWNLFLNISTIAIFNRKLEWCWLWAAPRIPAMCPLAANLIRWAAVVHADFLIRFAVDGGLSFNLGWWVVWRNSCIRWESCESKNNGKERQFWHFWELDFSALGRWLWTNDNKSQLIISKTYPWDKSKKLWLQNALSSANVS